MRGQTRRTIAPATIIRYLYAGDRTTFHTVAIKKQAEKRAAGCCLLGKLLFHLGLCKRPTTKRTGHQLRANGNSAIGYQTEC